MRRHQRQAKGVAAFAGKCEADQTAAEGGHEVDRFRGYFFGGDSQVAFVLAILVVDHDEHAPGASFLDRASGMEANGITVRYLTISFGCKRQAEDAEKGFETPLLPIALIPLGFPCCKRNRPANSA